MMKNLLFTVLALFACVCSLDAQRIYTECFEGYAKPDFSVVNEDGVELFYKYDYDFYLDWKDPNRIYVGYKPHWEKSMLSWQSYLQLGHSNSDGVYTITKRVKNGNVILMPNYKNLHSSLKKEVDEGRVYYYSDNNYENVEEINIPSHVTYEGKTYKVTKISCCVFRGCDKLRRITVPNTVIALGQGCFCDNPNLEEIVFEKGTTIDFREGVVINNCPKIKVLSLPSITKRASINWIYYCPNLEKLYIDSTWYDKIDLLDRLDRLISDKRSPNFEIIKK